MTLIVLTGSLNFKPTNQLLSMIILLQNNNNNNNKIAKLVETHHENMPI